MLIIIMFIIFILEIIIYKYIDPILNLIIENPISNSINVKNQVINILKSYSIVQDIKLIKKSLFNAYMEFDVVLDTNELIMDELLGNDTRKNIEDSIDMYTDYLILHSKYWNIKTNIILMEG